MRVGRVTVASVTAILCVVACGKSAKELCNEGIQVNCDKIVECQGDGGGFGFKSSSECVTFARLVLASADGGTNCDTVTEANACSSGRTYNSANADHCLDAVRNASCVDYPAIPKDPPCSEICK